MGSCLEGAFDDRLDAAGGEVGERVVFKTPIDSVFIQP
jgi:hypothetical protein